MVDMKGAVKNGSINKLKIADLKNYLKSAKLPQNGEKEDLVLRCSLHVRSEGLDVGDGRNPFDLKPAELRKAVAQRGLNPMGEKDELLQLLIDHIEQESGGGGGVSGGGDAGGDGGGRGGKSSDDSEGVSIAKKVLELDDDACGILSVLGEEITAKSSVGAMKKQYLLISRLIHPDKIPGFGQATKAFQLLVSAYEGLSQPDATKFDTSKPKSKTINRSNEGCHNTKVCCPRCMAPWGEAVDGLEPAAYMHMMTGIKTYHCSTCLLEFGCMSAEHRCPFCRKGFDYSPDDFHRKVQCGNKGCTREFGFMQYNVSESRLKELREELKSSQERRIKRQEAIMRRNARASTKGGGSGGGAQDSGALALAEEVKAFKAGLLDECPRCGWSMGKRDGADEAVEHLKGCKDEKKVAAHQKKKRQAADLQRQRDAKKGAQEEVTGLKTWEFLGGENENMWLLSEEQLRKQCKQYGLETDGEKNEMIARLVRHRNALDSSRMIADSAGGGTARNKGASMPTRHTLPSNLETMTLEQLKSVAASHGIECKGTSKKDVIASIESERFRDEPQLRLTMTAEHEQEEGIKRRKAGAGASKRKKQALDDSSGDEAPLVKSATKKQANLKKKKAKKDSDESDEDDDYEPDE